MLSGAAAALLTYLVVVFVGSAVAPGGGLGVAHAGVVAGLVVGGVVAWVLPGGAKQQGTGSHEADEPSPVEKREVLRQQLLAMAARDVGARLTAIVGVAHMIEAHFDPGSPEAQLAGRLIGEVQRLHGVAREMGDLATTTPPRVLVSFARCDLEAEVRAAIAKLEPSLGGREVLLQSQEPIQVVADSEALFRIIDNLVTYAAKFSRPNTPIVVQLHPGTGEALVSVWSLGGMLDPARVERTFQLDFESAAALGGEDFALAIVRLYAEALGGRAWLEREGSRTVFRFSLASGEVTGSAAEPTSKNRA